MGEGHGWHSSTEDKWLKSLPRTLDRKLLDSRTEIERYFSRKKNVFHLGEERTRGLKNFEANCYFTSIMEYLEHIARWVLLFTKLFPNICHRGQPEGIVEAVVVHQDWQRKGIGRIMMDAAKEISEKNGCYKLVLSSNHKRESAHRFYESLGFEKHGYSFSISVK